MFKRAVKKGGKYFEALLQLAPSCESMADSCRSGELNSVSSVFVQYGPFVYGKSAKSVHAIWTIHLWKEREECSCNMNHSFMKRARSMF